MSSFRAEDPPARKACRDQAPIEAPRVVLGDEATQALMAQRDAALLSSRTGRQPLRVVLSPKPAHIRPPMAGGNSDLQRRAVYAEQRPGRDAEVTVTVPPGVVVQVIPSAWQVAEARAAEQQAAARADAVIGTWMADWQRKRSQRPAKGLRGASAKAREGGQ